MTIENIESLAANAWRAEIEQIVDGWRLRAAQGVTRRANSVLPIADDGQIPLDEKLAIVEDFYQRWEQPACFQLNQAVQPPGLIPELARRGFQDNFHTEVQTASLDTILSHRRENLAFTLRLEDKLFPAWLDLYTAKYDSHNRTVREGILKRIGPRAAFAMLSDGNTPVAIGLGVLERGWLGFYCMVTAEAYRRKGAASQILSSLAEWGQAHGARDLYLQVMENNPPGLGLYARFGFKKLYRYWYAQIPSLH